MSLVQVTNKNLTSPGTTQTTPAISTTAANVLAFCAVYKAVNTGVVTPSDSTGQVWIPAPGSPYSGGATGLTLAVWYAKNITGNAANTFTLASTGADTPTIFVAEFAGRDQFAPFDISLTASDSIAASGAHTTGSIFATGGDDLLAFNVSSALTQSYAATGAWAIPPNGTVTSATGYDAFVQYQNNANQGPAPNTYSVTVADKLDAFVVSFKLPAIARSDEWLDYFNEVPEVSPIINAYQQWDYPPQLPDVDVDWNDESYDGEEWTAIEDQSAPVIADNVTSATVQYYGDEAELADEAIELQQFATTYISADFFLPPVLEETWDWFQEIDDDSWAFRDTDALSGGTIDATSLVFADLSDWDEDPDDFYADDFGNDDADLPQNDPWDYFVTDDDEYVVTDDYLNLTNPGPLPIIVEDGWAEHFPTEGDDWAIPDDYLNPLNGLLNSEDPTWWDEEPDQNDGTAHDLDAVGPDNNGLLNIEDAFEHWLTEDDDYVVIDDYALIDVAVNPSIATEDPWLWDEEPDQLDGTTHDLDPVGPSLVIAAAQPPEDPTDWTQAEDDWVVPDDYALISVAPSAQVPVADVWDHWLTEEDDYVVLDDYQLVNNTPTVVADAWDHWLTEPDDEAYQSLDTDIVSVPQPAAIEDPFDWTQDADDEEWIFRNAEPVIPLQGNCPEDAWNHWLTEDDDYVVTDDYALVNSIIAPSQITDDPWDWFYEPAEDNEQGFAVEGTVLPPNVYVFDPNFEVYMETRSFTVIWLPTGEGTI